MFPSFSFLSKSVCLLATILTIILLAEVSIVSLESVIAYAEKSIFIRAAEAITVLKK